VTNWADFIGVIGDFWGFFGLFHAVQKCLVAGVRNAAATAAANRVGGRTRRSRAALIASAEGAFGLAAAGDFAFYCVGGYAHFLEFLAGGTIGHDHERQEQMFGADGGVSQGVGFFFGGI